MTKQELRLELGKLLARYSNSQTSPGTASLTIHQELEWAMIVNLRMLAHHRPMNVARTTARAEADTMYRQAKRIDRAIEAGQQAIEEARAGV